MKRLMLVISQLKKHSLGKITLRDAAFTLADVDDNGKVDVGDLAIMKKHILGKIDLIAKARAEQETTTVPNGTIAE